VLGSIVIVEGDSERMSENAIRTALMNAYNRFGERLCIVLEAALAIAKRNRVLKSRSLGDFDYKSLVEELNRRGYRYSPSQLLRILEREYGVIETTYHTESQHWYKFVDLETVEEFINELRGLSSILEDPEIVALKVQIRSLGLRRWLDQLKKWSVKPRLTKADIRKFQEFAFKILPKIVKILKRAEEFDEVMIAETRVLKEVLELAYIVSERIEEIAPTTKGIEDDVRQTINVHTLSALDSGNE